MIKTLNQYRSGQNQLTNSTLGVVKWKLIYFGKPTSIFRITF